MFSVLKGDQLAANGSIYKFTHKTTHGRYCFINAEGSPLEKTETQLTAAWIAKDLVLNPVDESSPDYQKRFLIGDFNSLPEKWKKVARFREKIVKAIDAANAPKDRKKTWAPIIAEHTPEGETPVNPETVNDWLKRWKSRNGDIRMLVPGFAARGPAPMCRRTPDQEFYLGLIDRLYLNDRRAKRAAVFRQIVLAYEAAKLDDPNLDWVTPKRATFYRDIDRIAPREKIARQYGKKAADDAFHAVGKGREAAFRLEIVEIDHTELDIIIKDEYGRELGRPTLTVAIDKFTRMILGFYIGMEPAGTYAAMQCLYNAIMPKSYVAEYYPEIVGDWPAYGVPALLVSDNAKEFCSETFLNACAVLGIDTDFNPVKKPEYKGTVERFNRTLTESLLTLLPGKTFQSVKERGDYNSSKKADLQLHDIRMIFTNWVIADYSTRLHSQTMRVPRQAWEEEVEKNPVRLPMKVSELDMLLGMYEVRVLSRQGVKFKDIYYNSPQLTNLLNIPGWNREIQLRINPADLNTISVIHPQTDKLFTVPSINPAYTDGLTLEQHKAIRKQAREKGEDYRKDRAAERSAFLKNVNKLLDNPRTTRRKSKARVLGGDNTTQPKTVADVAIPNPLSSIDDLMKGPEAVTPPIINATDAPVSPARKIEPR